MLLVASSTTWYAARAGGVVAYLLVSASVLAGILLAGRRHVPGLPRFAVEDVHRFLGILAGLFIAVHVGSIALDSVVPFSLGQLVIPFTAGYRPVATGLGVVALELLLAVSLTNALRSRLPYRLWRRAHYATLAVWGLATFHGILSGTDRAEAWLLGIYGASVAAVVVAMVLRFSRAPAARRVGWGLAAAGGALATVLGLAVVPQQRSSARQTDALAAIPEISGDLTGRIDDDGTGIVSISGTAASRSAFRIDLLARAGRVADSALQVRFSDGTACEGTLTALDDSGFAGTCSLPDGTNRAVSATWTVSGGMVSGTIATAAASPQSSADDAAA